MRTIPLGHSLFTCPHYWKNYIRRQQELQGGRSTYSPARMRDNLFEEYNATIDEYCLEVQFNDEKLYTMFILKYGN